MFRASSLPGKPGRFRASDYLCSSEHTCIDCIAHIPRFRAVTSSSLLGTLLLCSARNTASLPASMLGILPPCLLLCPARNIASLPASSYALLGTLLPCLLLCSEHCFLLCSARNTASLSASMPCSEHCFFACFYALLLVWIQLETLHISPLTVSLHSYVKKSKFRPKSRKNYINKQLPPISTSSNS